MADTEEEKRKRANTIRSFAGSRTSAVRFRQSFARPGHPVAEMTLEWITVTCGAPPDPAMPRASLEDCLQRIPNHFDLCAIASKRARQLARGAPSQVPVGSHKSTVLSLIEISRGLVDRTVLDEKDLPPVESSPVRFDPLELPND